LSSDVQQRFLNARDTLQGTVRPGFHGTAPANLASIYERGLLIPGQDNELHVANGSAHGNGIYTAKVNSPSLSLSFCSSDRRMLVCGILDDAQQIQQYSYGNYSVSMQSESVRHVGNAVVVFDHRRVAPLFEAFLPIPFYSRVTLGSSASVSFDWARHRPHSRMLARILEMNKQEVVKKRKPTRNQLLRSQVRLNTCSAFLARRAASRRR